MPCYQSPRHDLSRLGIFYISALDFYVFSVLNDGVLFLLQMNVVNQIRSIADKRFSFSSFWGINSCSFGPSGSHFSSFENHILPRPSLEISQNNPMRSDVFVRWSSIHRPGRPVLLRGISDTCARDRSCCVSPTVDR